MSEKGEKARRLFLEGYNCAQAVFVAFATDEGMSEKSALKLASSFGGGLGRMGEVCGAVSGMAMALGLIKGNADKEGKLTHYARVRELVGKFADENGGYICRELLSTGDKGSCADFVYSAAEILENYLKENE